mgnify:CR=1 FL=1
MVKGMRIVKEASTKKEGVTFCYLEIDFGYRKAKVFELDNLLYPELCGLTAEQFYNLDVGKSLPVKFDLPAIHNEARK